MKAAELVGGINEKEFEIKKEFAEREVEYSMSRIKIAEKCIDDNKEYIKRLEKKLKKAQKKHAKLLEKDINDFEPKSYVTFGNNRVEIVDWKVEFDPYHLTNGTGCLHTHPATTDSFSINCRCASDEAKKLAIRRDTVKMNR